MRCWQLYKVMEVLQQLVFRHDHFARGWGCPTSCEIRADAMTEAVVSTISWCSESLHHASQAKREP